MAKIKILHGPNLNLLGAREPEIYGHTTLAQLNERIQTLGKELGHEVICFQSNSESALIDEIQQAMTNKIDFFILNLAAFTHTSIALRDALLSVKVPFIEVHLSNIFAREPYRHHSHIADRAVGVICGFGIQSYELAMHAANRYLNLD